MTTMEKTNHASLATYHAVEALSRCDQATARRHYLAAIAWLTDAITDIEAPTEPEPDVWLCVPGRPPHLCVELLDYNYRPAHIVHRN